MWGDVKMSLPIMSGLGHLEQLWAVLNGLQLSAHEGGAREGQGDMAGRPAPSLPPYLLSVAPISTPSRHATQGNVPLPALSYAIATCGNAVPLCMAAIFCRWLQFTTSLSGWVEHEDVRKTFMILSALNKAKQKNASFERILPQMTQLIL